MNTCSRCEQTLPLTEFYAGDTDKSWCKCCKREYAKIWRKANKEKKRSHDIKANYGISLEKWQQMFEEQKGCCKICGIHQSKLKTRLHTDHNHQTGEVRGLLCNKCNRGIGYFDDNIEILKEAIKYLENK